jgi:tetratricopeptide (TPR) repeat protein
VAWLESLAAKHGAKPEELVTDPSKRFEKPPEWVSQAQSIGEAQSASALEEEKSNQQPERVEHALNIGEQFFAEFESGSTAAPAIDETSAWLRSLDEEEKQEKSSSALNDIPDWLNDSKSEREQTEGQNLHHSEIPEWLSDAQQPQDSAGQFEYTNTESGAEKSDLPNWLSDVEKDAAQQNTFISQDISQNELSNWLNGLDDEPGLPFDAIPTPDSILFSSISPEPVRNSKEQEPVAAKSDLPDWLSSVDSQNVEPADEWKNSIQEEPAAPDSKQTEMPVPASQTESLPDWLQEMDNEEPTIVDDDTPPWLHREKWEAQAEEPQEPMPTSPSDWHPIVTNQPESTLVQKQETPVETRKPFAPLDVPPPQPIPVQPAVSGLQPSEPPAKKKKAGGLPARKQQSEAPSVIVALNQAKGELDRGDIPAALAHYGKLIKKGKHLEETIRDLTESIYRYPVEVGIWQTLGDAYMRANRLKEALEAYNKAEELIR